MWAVGLFGVIWTSLVLIFDAVMLGNVYYQLQASHYPVVNGRILETKITSHSDSEGGTTYRPYVEYEYEIDGQRYVSEQLRYGQMGTSDRSYAEGITESYDLEEVVAVYYNPDDPSDAVLRTEIDSTDVFMLLFLTPFNVVMIFLWYMGGMSLWYLRGPPVRGGAKIEKRGWETRAKVNRGSPFLAFLVGIGGGAFLMIFVVALTMGFGSKIGAIIGLVVAIGAGVAAAVWQWLRNQDPEQELVIDHGRTCLVLPVGEGRKEPLSIPLTEISRVDVEDVQKTDSDGDTSHQYAPRIHAIRDGRPVTERIMQWSNEKCAQSFTTWLGGELGVSPPEEDASAKR